MGIGDREQVIRPAAVAGQFYPRQERELRAAIEAAFLSPLGPGAIPALGSGTRRVLGVVAAHAGYVYSGPAAAWSFAAAARDGKPEAVVILGVNHRGAGAALAVSPAQAWETPLGQAPVANSLRDRLLTLVPDLTTDARAHAAEHSLEVQVPFIQTVFGDVPIVPIVIGYTSLEALRRLGQALAVLAEETELLIVASSDFSHYISEETAARQDRLALERIAAVDPDGLLHIVRQHDITMCGVLPVAAMLIAARTAGALTGAILHYHTSGAVTGDTREVVGYGAAAVSR